MPANDQHPEYASALSKWAVTRDCVAGAEAVKKKRTKYLPKPNPDDTTQENSDRYDAYIERANFVGFTASTLDGMLGMVFREPMRLELDAPIDYMRENINGGGLTADQMARAAIGHILETGRYGLLTDYPEAPAGLTKAQITALNLQATILPYASENIINWQTATVGAVKMLSMVVLREMTREYADDGFSFSEKEYHRVLVLRGGVYTQELYDDDNELISAFEPRKADGSTWNNIPFIFAGATNNDESIDKAPLYDIAEVNVAHYRNSADFEESSFMVGQPTPVLSGLTPAWVEKVMKNGVMFGSRRAILLPEGGNGNLLQAVSNQMPERGMEAKEQQMVKLGARIIQDAGGNETAEAAKIRFAGQNSKLGTIVGNVDDAMLTCFDWANEFMGGTGENIVELNKDFYDKTADPQLVIAQIQLLDRGVIAMSDMREGMRDAGVIDKMRTDEDIEGEAEAISPVQ